MDRPRRTLFLLGFALLSLARCGGNVVVDGLSGATSTTGAGGAPGTGGGPSSPDTTSTGTGTGAACGSLHVSANAACQACAETSCCGQLRGCDRGTACGSILQCVLNCGATDTSCATGCAQSFPGGVQDLASLSSCLVQCPQGACADPPGTACDTSLVARTPSCNACLTGECCAEAEQCASDPACQKCFQAGIQDPDCDPVYATLAQCQAARCPMACP